MTVCKRPTGSVGWLCSTLTIVTGLSVGGATAAQEAPFLRGDANLDGELNIADPVLVLRALFLGESTRGCDDAADMDDDGQVDLEDCILGLHFLFLDGPSPSEPFGECGSDPTADELVCLLHPL